MNQEERIEKWKKELPVFQEKAAAYYHGTYAKKDYKGFSGRYGTYAQREDGKSMLRLRMTGGDVSAQNAAFIAKSIQKYNVKKMHFTTGQAIQLHDLGLEAVCGIMEEAVSHGILTMGAGGDYPRNVLCSPLSGLEVGEYFDVLPYAKAAADFALNFVFEETLPRKYKIAFSNTKENIPHATFHDLGFVACPDKTFSVYSAGGLGPNPKLGVLVAEHVPPDQILYYIEAMRKTFIKYGNYKSRAKARTRYMQDACGGPEGYKEAFLAELKLVYDSGEDLSLKLEAPVEEESGEHTMAESPAATEPRIRPQKQPGRYMVAWHPIGGCPDPQLFCRISDALQKMPGSGMRLTNGETAWIINLSREQAEDILRLTDEDSMTAQTTFETSICCIGASVCQVGLRDSQKLLHRCIQAVREAQIPDRALPRIRISGCVSSCSAHQTAPLAFRGASLKGKPAYLLFVDGCDVQGKEVITDGTVTILEERIPDFLVELGRTVAASGMTYEKWHAAFPGKLVEMAEHL